MDGLLDLAFSSPAIGEPFGRLVANRGGEPGMQMGPPLSPPTAWPALCSVRRVLDEFSAVVSGYQSQAAV